MPLSLSLSPCLCVHDLVLCHTQVVNSTRMLARSSAIDGLAPNIYFIGISNHLSGPKLLNKSEVLSQIDDELTIKSNQNKSSLVGQSWIYKSISCSISYKQLSKVFSAQIEVNTTSNHPIYVLALLENEVNSCFMNNDKFCSTSSYNSKKTSFTNFCSSH